MILTEDDYSEIADIKAGEYALTLVHIAVNSHN